MTAVERNLASEPCQNGHVGQWASIGSKKYGVCKECRKSIKRKSRYGITEEQYQELFADQRGCCAICWQATTEELAVDHDHDTKQVRALLCKQCNTLVGVIESGFVRLAMQYLKKHGKEV